MVRNFSMTLTELLTSPLFKIETLVTGAIYRVYPLFYCDTITSSNSNDRILGNQCLILEKTAKETYLNFINNAYTGDSVVYDEDVIDDLCFYEIEDSMSIQEYNGLIQFLRLNKSFQENIKVQDNLIRGSYGDYLFNLESTTIVDNGVLITDETLTNLGTVRLINPLYNSSQYVLTLTVMNITDFNIMDANVDNIEKTTLTINLVPDVDVTIPFNTLDEDSVVLFDATVDVINSNNIVQYPNSLSLTSNYNAIVIGNSVTLTATYLDSSSDPISGETIYLKKVDGTTITSGTTGADGKVSFTYTPAAVGSYSVYAVDYYNNRSLTKTIQVNKKTFDLICRSNKNSIDVPGTVIIRGALTYNGANVSNIPVKVYRDGTLVSTINTDANGEISYSYSLAEFSASANSKTVDWFLKVVAGTTYNGIESNYVSTTFYHRATKIITDNTSYSGSQVSVKGKLSTDGTDIAVSGATIKLVNASSELLASTTTANNGTFTLVLASSSIPAWQRGTRQCTVKYEGSTVYGRSSKKVTITLT